MEVQHFTEMSAAQILCIPRVKNLQEGGTVLNVIGYIFIACGHVQYSSFIQL